MATAQNAINGERWLEADKGYFSIITLDIKNVFNSADRNITLAGLDEKDMPNYLLEFIKGYFKDSVHR